MIYVFVYFLFVFATVNGQDNDGNNDNNANNANNNNNNANNNNNFACPHSFGYEPNPQDAGCGSYWDCEYQVATLRQCPNGDQFDFHKRQCLRDQDVFCQQQLQNWRNRPPQPVQRRDEDSSHSSGVEVDTTLIHLLVPGANVATGSISRGDYDEDNLGLLALLARGLLPLLPLPRPVQPNLLPQGGVLQPNQGVQQPNQIRNDGFFNQPGNRFQPNQFGNGIGLHPNQFGVGLQPNQFQAAGILTPVQGGQQTNQFPQNQLGNGIAAQPNLFGNGQPLNQFQPNLFGNGIAPQPNQFRNGLIPNQIQPNQFGNGIAPLPNQFGNGLIPNQFQPNLIGNGIAGQSNQFVGGVQPPNGNVQPNQFAFPPTLGAVIPNQLQPQFQNQLAQPAGNPLGVQNGLIVPTANNNPAQVNPNVINAGGLPVVNQDQQANLAPAVGAPFLDNPFGFVQAADGGGGAGAGVQNLNANSRRETQLTTAVTQNVANAGVQPPRLYPLPVNGVSIPGTNAKGFPVNQNRYQHQNTYQNHDRNGATEAFIPAQSQNRFSASVTDASGPNGSVVAPQEQAAIQALGDRSSLTRAQPAFPSRAVTGNNTANSTAHDGTGPAQ